MKKVGLCILFCILRTSLCSSATTQSVTPAESGLHAILLPLLLTAVEIYLILFALYSIIKALIEFYQASSSRRLLWFGPWPALILFILTLILTGFSFLYSDGWLMYILSIPFLCLTCAAANMQVRWDNNGFQYRTVMRRKVRYEYQDIRWAKVDNDLLLRVGHRLIVLDSMMGFSSFLSEYNNWRSRNGLQPICHKKKKNRR